MPVRATCSASARSNTGSGPADAAPQSRSPSSRWITHQAPIPGTSACASLDSMSGTSSEALTATVASVRYFPRCSSRRAAVTSCRMLTASSGRPSFPSTGRARISDHHSRPVVRSRTFTVTMPPSSPRSTRRPGRLAKSNGCPCSSVVSKRSKIAAGGVLKSCSTVSKPHRRAAALFANTSCPDGSWTVMPSSTPSRITSSRRLSFRYRSSLSASRRSLCSAALRAACSRKSRR
jgi:hypothetical protein